MMEKALGELISHQGDIHRYQRKSKKVITERKEFFANLLQTHLKDQITFSTPDSGLAFWIRFKNFFSTNATSKNGKKKRTINTKCLSLSKQKNNCFTTWFCSP